MEKAAIYLSAEHIAHILGVKIPNVTSWIESGMVPAKKLKSGHYAPITPISDDQDANTMTVAFQLKFTIPIEFEKQSEKPGALNIIKYKKAKAEVKETETDATKATGGQQI